MRITTRTVVMPNKTKLVCHTIAGLSKLSGKSSITLRRWEQKGWLPVCNFRMPAKVIAGQERLGERLYSDKYAKLMAAEIKKVKRGEKVPHEVTRLLAIYIKQERDEYLK